jgi:hypothetical protein
MYGRMSARWPLSEVIGWASESTAHPGPERLSDPAEAQDNTDLSAGRACDSLSAPTTEPEIQP